MHLYRLFDHFIDFNGRSVGVEPFDKNGSWNFQTSYLNSNGQGCTDTCIEDGALTVCCPSVYCKNEALPHWKQKGGGIWGTNKLPTNQPEVQVPKMEVRKPYKAIFGVGFPLHKPN